MEEQIFDACRRIKTTIVCNDADGNPEVHKTTSIFDLLEEIRTTGHYHTVTKGKTVYTCDYHTESVYDHLIMAMRAAIAATSDPRDQFLAGFIALVHDIGKPAAMKLHACENLPNSPIQKNYISYHGHAELGALILKQFDASLAIPEIAEQYGLSSSWFIDVEYAVLYHMCLHRVECVGLFPESIHAAMKAAHIGDVCGKVPSDSSMIETAEQVNARWDPLNFKDSVCALSSTGPAFPKQILIVLFGRSGHGKSTMAQQIMHLYPDSVHISRDACMIETYTAVSGLEYTDYQTARSFCKENKLDQQINRLFASKVADALDTKHIVIIESLMYQFVPCPGGSWGSSDYIVPRIVEGILRLGIWCDRPLSAGAETRLNCTRADQLRISGPRNWNLETNSPSGLYIGHPEFCMDNMSIWASNPKTWVQPHLLTIHPHVACQWIRKLKEPGPNTDLPNDNPSSMSLFQVLRGKDLAWIQTWCKRNGLTWSVNDQSDFQIVSVKYIDNNPIWHTRWMLEARGSSFIMYDGVIQYQTRHMMERGTEILTHAVKSVGMDETQDYSTRSGFSHFYRPIARILQEFEKNSDSDNINCAITAKVDGSLLTCTVIPMASVPSRVYECLESIVDKYSGQSKLHQYVRASTPPDMLVILGTMGNMIIRPDSEMGEYTLTAIVGSATPREMWFADPEAHDQLAMDSFVSRCVELSKSRYSVLHFESVVRARTTRAGVLHKELAVSHNRDMVVLLGQSQCKSFESGQYYFYPHYMLGQTLFEEPMYVINLTPAQVSSKVSQLESLIYQPDLSIGLDNIFGPQPSNVCREICPEGFVVFCQVGSGYLPSRTTTVNNLVYCKAKVPVYYQCHKPREEYSEHFCKYERELVRFFPIVRAVVCLENNLVQKLSDTAEMVRRAVSGLSQSETIRQYFPSEKVWNSFQKQDIQTKGRMLVCASDWLKDPLQTFPDVPLWYRTPETESEYTQETKKEFFALFRKLALCAVLNRPLPISDYKELYLNNIDWLSN